MFQKNKNTYHVEAECSNENHTQIYSVYDNYDTSWDEVASRKFEEEFGERPKNIKRLSMERYI